MCQGTGFEVSLPLQVAVNVMVSVAAQVLGNDKQIFSVCLFFSFSLSLAPHPQEFGKKEVL